jgi:hypothetical protein
MAIGLWTAKMGVQVIVAKRTRGFAAVALLIGIRILMERQTASMVAPQIKIK